jgi:hypothetical protein
MQTIVTSSNVRAPQIKEENARHNAWRFVDSLKVRLGELERMARLAKNNNVITAIEYVKFKKLFTDFCELCEEFQILSRLTEDSLTKTGQTEDNKGTSHRELEEYFHKLQVPMLRAVIRTNLRLLRVWDNRLQRGEGLPYGVYEVFLETVRVIYNARSELLRPRYIALLDDIAMEDADRADRLLRTLILQAPQLFNFATNIAFPDLMRTDDDVLNTSIRSSPPQHSALPA